MLSVLAKLIAFISGLTTQAALCRDCHFQHSNLCLRLGFSNYVPKAQAKNCISSSHYLCQWCIFQNSAKVLNSFSYVKTIKITHFKQTNCSIIQSTVLFTLFKSPMWKPANSLTFISASLRGDSPVIPWSSCLKSLLCTKERPLEWFFTFIPISCGTFLPTEPIIRSDSIFV